MSVSIQSRSFDEQRLEALQHTKKTAIFADLRTIHTDLQLDHLKTKMEQGEVLDTVTELIFKWHQSFVTTPSHKCEGF